MNPALCPVCRETVVANIRPWHLECPSCHYEGSSLVAHIGGSSEIELDEMSREAALLSLRQRNFRSIAAEVSALARDRGGDARPRLLDVGCAHGWFLQACQPTFDVTGIEPDRAIAGAASGRVGQIRQGFFPEVLSEDETFDVIIFNDVLEHIPDVAATLQACNKHLLENGLLAVNAPSRKGAIYRLTKFLARMGFPASFDRMWQLGFPSPHVHYFDTRSMRALTSAAKFELIKCSRLPSVSARGLYSRIRYSKETGSYKALMIASAVLLSIPLLRLLPPDIEIWYFRKREEV